MKTYENRNEQLELELCSECKPEAECLNQSVESDGKKIDRKFVEMSYSNERCENTLAFILRPDNLRDAFEKVASKKGAAGVDGMKAEGLMRWFDENQEWLTNKLAEGTYEPMPVRRVQIPKDNGTKRNLGIPTVIDRGVQMAIANVLNVIYEPRFSENSFGFRPNRSVHDALKRCLEIANSGQRWVVDMDLEKYFDTVPQARLLQIVSETIKDGRVISLLSKFLKAGVMINGVCFDVEAGVPQGGNLSPILANIMLDVCDKELERRGLRFVRYADDMMIFANTERSAIRIMESITRFIEDKLHLKVNKEKTVVRYITNGVKFLGHGFYTQTKGEIGLTIHRKSVEKMKNALRELLKRNNPRSGRTIIKLVNYKVEGWVRFFRYADAKSKLEDLDGWMRHKIRCLILKRNWRPRSRYKLFRKFCKLDHEKAKSLANSRQGYWDLSEAEGVNYALNNKRLSAYGFKYMSDVYLAVHTTF